MCGCAGIGKGRDRNFLRLSLPEIQRIRVLERVKCALVTWIQTRRVQSKFDTFLRDKKKEN